MRDKCRFEIVATCVSSQASASKETQAKPRQKEKPKKKQIFRTSGKGCALARASPSDDRGREGIGELFRRRGFFRRFILRGGLFGRRFGRGFGSVGRQGFRGSFLFRRRGFAPDFKLGRRQAFSASAAKERGAIAVGLARIFDPLALAEAKGPEDPAAEATFATLAIFGAEADIGGGTGTAAIATPSALLGLAAIFDTEGTFLCEDADHPFAATVQGIARLA